MIKDFEFVNFVLNEQHLFLSEKIGDILTAVHDLNQDGKSMSSRDLIRFSERIVNQIRRILHSQWAKEEQAHLKTLQKIGVALMKTMDERGDIHDALAGAANELEGLSHKLGMPINRLASPDKSQPDPQNLPKQENPKKQMTNPVQTATMPPQPQPQTVDNSPPLGGPQNPPISVF